jgi:hypothetical protein
MKRYIYFLSAIKTEGFRIFDKLTKTTLFYEVEERKAIDKCNKLNKKNEIAGETYSGYEIHDTYFICTCGHRHNLKKFIDSGEVICRYCWNYIPRHIIEKKYNERKRQQQRNKSHGLKAFS